MTHLERAEKVEQAVRLGTLFTAFLTISLCGVGGGSGIVWARRVAVENRCWITDGEFADIVSLCQFHARAEHNRDCRLHRREDAGRDRGIRCALRLSCNPLDSRTLIWSLIPLT
jgi:hypothetical protein